MIVSHDNRLVDVLRLFDHPHIVKLHEVFVLEIHHEIISFVIKR